VYCRKTGLKVAECKPGKQAWYQNGHSARTPVFAVEIDGPPIWIGREDLSRLKKGSKIDGVVFTTRRGFNRAEPYDGVRGYLQLPSGSRVRVVHLEGRWLREILIEARQFEAITFELPVVPDQTAE
jgi:hypothetical protein